jgi:uncharacterized protein
VRETILWRGIFWPGHEHCAVYDEDSRLFVEGVAVFKHEAEPCRLEYVIECDDTWTTQSARVSGYVGKKPIGIEIKADADRNWFFNGSEQPDVKGCTDVDLNFSPSTNLLPIRRLSLKPGQQAMVSAAWLRFPSFKLERLDQVYRRMGQATYRYESNDGAFVSELKVNAFGLVINYPELWEEER